ncbi:MAG: hypothetical protein CVU61_11385 [Deltaproteobacteria bacterium HGW-Deltaproteobacteria-19]|jgi:PAS domain S-box-containing protein|nr:MAG: hypothetical protein CVU61_11385 [Deltaproteobacteria bacterium HGW-Deltaproteobacteria-19]
MDVQKMTREQLLEENIRLRRQIEALKQRATPDGRELEEILGESEDKYLALVEKVNEGIIIVQDERFIFVNRKMSALLGVPVENLIGRKVFDYIWPEDRDRIAANYEGRLGGKDIESAYELRIKGAGGTLKWVTLSVTLIQWNGRPASLNLITDITERKAAENNLRLSELKFRAVTESSSTAIFLIQDTKYIYINPAFETMTGYTMNDLAGMSFWDFIHPDQRELVKTRGLNRLKGENPRARYEFKIITNNGKEKWVDFSATAIRLNDIPTIVGSSTDITERTEAEEKLRDNERFLADLIENSGALIYVKSKEGRYLLVNRKWEQITGSMRKDVLGRTDEDLFPGPVGRQFRLNDLAVMESGTTWELEEFLEDVCGRRFFNSIKFPLRDTNGVVSGLCGMTTEITERKAAEEALQETEERFRLIMENVHDTVWLMDMNLHTTWISSSVEKKRGFTLEELQRLPLERHLTVFSFQTALDLIEKNLTPEKLADPREEITISAELEFYRKDGSTFWADTVITLLRDGQGAPAGFLGVSRDTTERRRMEEELRKSGENYRRLFENAGEGIMIVRGETIRLANPAFLKTLGYTEDTLTERPFTSFIHPDDRAMVLDRHRRRMEGESVETGYSFRIMTADGKEKWMEIHSQVIDWEGAPASLSFVMDITARKRMEEELLESQRRLGDIIDFLPDATLVIDREGRVIAWNRAMEAMTGIRQEQMLGKGDRAYSIPFYGDRRPILIDLALRPDPERERQYTSFRRQGDTIFGEAYTVNLPPGNIHLSATASVLRDSRGEIIAAIECVRDNTERKRMEERLARAEKMEALGTLAGGVAHDLNNVLGVLVGYSELLAEKLPLGGQMRRYADNILQSGVKGAAIIQDLLTLARRGVAVSEVVDLNTVIGEYLRTPEFEKLMSDHGQVICRQELAGDLLYIKGSPIHLAKTVMNLVSNAVEAIPGKGIMAIRTENRYLDQPISGYDDVQEGDYVILTVSDSGNGIAAKDIDKIFEPFYSKKVMGRSGTGLGLAVVWGTVKDHNGYIDVKSDEGLGTTFTLYFPVTREELAAPEKTTDVATYAGKGESVLVVDDVKEQRELAASMLGRLGYQVETVSSGEEALSYINRRKADLIVLDMIMDPGIDGLETYRRIREINPRQKAIIVSGFSETERVREAQDLGAGTFVRKPYIMEKIGLAARQELDRE